MMSKLFIVEVLSSIFWFATGVIFALIFFQLSTGG